MRQLLSRIAIFLWILFLPAFAQADELSDNRRFSKAEITNFVTELYRRNGTVAVNSPRFRKHDGYVRWTSKIVFVVDGVGPKGVERTSNLLHKVTDMLPLDIKMSQGNKVQGANFFITFTDQYQNVSDSLYLRQMHFPLIHPDDPLIQKMLVRADDKEKQVLASTIVQENGDVLASATLTVPSFSENNGFSEDAIILRSILLGLTGGHRVIKFRESHFALTPKDRSRSELFPMDRLFLSALYSDAIPSGITKEQAIPLIINQMIALQASN
ncbi:hypothetical protein [Aestuariispira insulae]|uniref:Uncharacterized protein n=1 Tax=Aestuariispira insulae TaxID=1461337 RepID=A0A3D9H1F9_9PROT|nr:hypothetical protein [Aestuariispira insulae]RED43328.1 hypothetical protein DFP90_1302 [Aestuariispira insulae]